MQAIIQMANTSPQVYILKDFENASPRLNPLFHKPWEVSEIIVLHIIVWPACSVS